MKATKKVTFFILLFLLIALSGCSQTIKPIVPHLSSAERILVKNYRINERMTASVGEQLIVHKDYYAFKRSVNKLIADNDFTITARSWSLSGKKNESLPLKGIAVYNSNDYYLLPLIHKSGDIEFYVLISHDGSVSNLGTISLPAYGTMKIYPNEYSWIDTNPKNVKFTLATDEVIDTQRGYTNFELIYTGKNNQSLTFLYREYTPDDLIRAAYSQNLVYSTDSKIIKFKKIKLKINKVTGDGIDYSVLED